MSMKKITKKLWTLHIKSQSLQESVSWPKGLVPKFTIWHVHVFSVCVRHVLFLNLGILIWKIFSSLALSIDSLATVHFHFLSNAQLNFLDLQFYIDQISSILSRLHYCWMFDVICEWSYCLMEGITFCLIAAMNISCNISTSLYLVVCIPFRIF